MLWLLIVLVLIDFLFGLTMPDCLAVRYAWYEKRLSTNEFLKPCPVLVIARFAPGGRQANSRNEWL